MENPYSPNSKVHPELKDGYIRIANSIFRALIGAGLSGSEYQILFFIIDRLWGWKNKDAKVVPIRLDDFLIRINIAKRNLIETIKKLEKKQIIFVNRGQKINKYGFNKYFDTWKIGDANITKNRGCKHHLLGDVSITKKVMLTSPKMPSPPIILKKRIKEKGKRKDIPNTNFNFFYERLKLRFEKFYFSKLDEDDARKMIFGRNETDREMIEKTVEIFNLKFGVETITWWNILNMALNEFGYRLQSKKIKSWNMGFIFAGLFGNLKKRTEAFLIFGVLDWDIRKIRGDLGIKEERVSQMQKITF